MKLTYLGHSCFLLETCGKTVLFDPFISQNPKASTIDINTLEPDYILVSHAHSDHIADLQSIAKRTNAKVVANWEITQWCISKGIENIHPMNIGGKWSFEFGDVITTTAIHSSSFADGSYGGTPMGFIIKNNEGTLYYAGDTALTLDMTLIGNKYTLSTAILPVGDNFTMGYEDALIASEYIKCDKIIGMHFDTFGYIEIPHDKAIGLFEENGKSLTLPYVRQIIEI